MKHKIIISVGLLAGIFFLSQSKTVGQEANLFVIRYIDVDRANAKEFEKAALEMKWAHDTSAPGEHARAAERYVQKVLEGNTELYIEI